MTTPDAILLAVLRTLVRATADGSAPVVLRSRRPAQAAALARWLTQVHGSRRVVIASTTARAPVVVRLPARLARFSGVGSDAGLAPDAAGHHLSRMTRHVTDTGFR